VVIKTNIAFIDGQNLHLGTRADGWVIDLERFRVYLSEKYQVSTAYYFLGCVSDQNTDLYNNIQKAGFVLNFREHNSLMIGNKKGNVDTDVVFEMMRSLIDDLTMDKIILVSGDGDYKKAVDYLIKKGRFLKILFPNKRYSSLYKELTARYFDALGELKVREKIEQKKRRT
jgi:uncharacterized LabA/DUF88 family protein